MKLAYDYLTTVHRTYATFTSGIVVASLSRWRKSWHVGFNVMATTIHRRRDIIQHAVCLPPLTQRRNDDPLSECSIAAFFAAAWDRRRDPLRGDASTTMSPLHPTNQRGWFRVSHESAYSAGICCRLSPCEVLHLEGNDS